MTAEPSAELPGTAAGPLPGHVRVAVVGAGFSGLGMARTLLSHGIRDLVVLERADRVGGTWRDNTYPGCGCDVPSHLYSYSFAPNPDWQHAYSRQEEILRYLEDVARHHGIAPVLRLGTEVLAASWDDAEGHWLLRTSRGTLSADVVVTATGPLTEPVLPDVPGLGDFPGPVFHTARWRHDVDLRGRRVAVVGTGASGIQVVPAIAGEVARLVLFQRTPPWVLPRLDRRIRPLEQVAYRIAPGLQRLVRGTHYTVRELAVPAFTRFPVLMRVAERLALAALRRQVPDPQLRARLTPGYRLGCKRVLPSPDYYRTLTAPNVEVVAAALDRVEGNTLVGSDGSRHEVDVVVGATGFDVRDLPVGQLVTGRDGRTLAEVWDAEGRGALRATTFHGFPNLFMMLGPQTGVGHTSMVYMIESQARYVLDALQVMAAGRLAALEARPDAQRRWTERLDRRMRRTVWSTGGCASWYQDGDGRISTLWPGATFDFRRRLHRLDLREYRTRQVGPRAVPLAPGAADGRGGTP